MATDYSGDILYLPRFTLFLFDVTITAVRRLLLPIVFFCILFGARCYADFRSVGIAINNTPLVVVNSRVISTVDVAKALEYNIVTNYPMARISPADRLAYYRDNWKDIVSQIVDEELILADSAGMEISPGSVRERVEEIIGQHYDGLLSRDDLMEMARRELVVRNALGLAVHLRSLQQVTPSLIRDAYDAYLTTSPPAEIWTYRSLSLSGGSDKDRDGLVKKIFSMIDGGESIDVIVQAIDGGEVSVDLSKERSISALALSEEFRSVLERLEVGEVSQPVYHSGSGAKLVLRLYHLINRRIDPPPTFDEMYGKIKDMVLMKEFLSRRSQYIVDLRKKFHVENPYLVLPEGYTPFKRSAISSRLSN